MPPRTSPSDPAVLTAPGAEPLPLLRLARTTGSERFQHELLRRLLDEFRADHGAINTWHPRSFVSSVGIGYDLAAMSEQWNRINGAELDFITFAMRAQPEQAREAEKRAARKERKQLTKEEQKAARDARYAARKARR